MSESPEVGGIRTVKIGGTENSLKTVQLLGFPVVTSGRDEIVQFCLDRIAARIPTHIVTLNPEMVLGARRDPGAGSAVRAGDCFIADGVGLEWAARQKGIQGVQRYPGVELCADLIGELSSTNGSVYLLGAAAGVAERAAEQLTAKFPGLNIIGLQDGFFAPEDEAEVISTISKSQPDLLLVGMGSPRQEGFISKYRDELNVPLMVGVGGALEVYAGIKGRAPGFFRRTGLEWAYRSIQDISRIKRLGFLPRFIWLVLADRGLSA